MGTSLARRAFCFAAPVSTVIAAAMFGQVSSVPGVRPEVKGHAFDVVSIKPSASAANWHFGLSPTGYSSAGMPMYVVLRQAFFPRNWGGKIVGVPAWVNDDRFDVEAKVTAADIDEWQKERIQPTQPLVQQLLQDMLADRCKLVAHRVPSETTGYAMTVDKRGAKLTEADLGEGRPDHGIPILGGGYMVPYQRGEAPQVSFYGVTMSAFADHLVGMGSAQVIDRTGLTGRYDFTLKWLSSSPDERVGAISADDPDKLSHWDFGALGLKAVQMKVPTEDLVIEHIEKPIKN